MDSTNPALSDFNAKITRPSSGAHLRGIEELPRYSSNDSNRAYQPVAAPDAIGDRQQQQCRLDRVKAAIKARSERLSFFPADLFADPVWDMLLELTRSELVGHRVSITRLCSATNVPSTTALRYIGSLTADGMLRRRPDPLDGRRVFVELSHAALDSMFNYLDAQG